MNKPRKNLADSVLARAELFRRNMLFEGVPAFGADLEMPAAPGAADATAAPSPDGAGAPEASSAVPAPGGTDQLVAGAVEGTPALETMIDPSK